MIPSASPEPDSNNVWTPVATLADFGAQRLLKREVANLTVLLYRIGNDVVAIHNHCTHLGKPLDGGRVFAGQLTCPFHGACFDLRSGKAMSGPAVMPLHTFPVRIDDGVIALDMRRRPAHLLPTQK